MSATCCPRCRIVLNHTVGLEARTTTGTHPLGKWQNTYTFYTLDTWGRMWQRPCPYTLYTWTQPPAHVRWEDGRTLTPSTPWTPGGACDSDPLPTRCTRGTPAGVCGGDLMFTHCAPWTPRAVWGTRPYSFHALDTSSGVWWLQPLHFLHLGYPGVRAQVQQRGRHLDRPQVQEAIARNSNRDASLRTILESTSASRTSAPVPAPPEPFEEVPTWPRFWASSTAVPRPHVPTWFTTAPKPHVSSILGLVYSRARGPPRGPEIGPRLQLRKFHVAQLRASTAAPRPHVAQNLGLVNSHAKAPRGQDLWTSPTGAPRPPRGPDFGPRPRPRGGPTWPRFAASTTGAPKPHVAQNGPGTTKNFFFID